MLVICVVQRREGAGVDVVLTSRQKAEKEHNAAMERPISAGVIPARGTSEGWKLLVLRAYRNWDFPKGVIDPGEEPLAAAKREAKEEAALTDLTFPFGEIYRETAPYSGGKVARYYLAVTKQEQITLPVSEELGRAEHDEGRWVSLDEAGRMLPPRLKPILEWVKRVFAETARTGRHP